MTRYDGQFSDGQSAASHKAGVSLGPDALVIHLEDGRRIAWAYEKLKSTYPVHPGETVLVGFADEENARLQVNVSSAPHRSGDFARELLVHAPHLSRRAANLRLFIPMAAATALVAAVGAWLWFSEYSPAQTMARWIPHSVRVKLGKQVVSSMAPADKICHSEAGDAALKALSDRLNGDQEHGRFNIRVAKMKQINAFAAPGEQIIISNKLIKFAKSPDEVAGVLAHEMGHGIETHPEAGLIRALGISTAVSIFLGGTSDNIASIGTMLLQMSYSRKAEREADAHALRILKAAKISPKPLAGFFVRVDRKMLGKSGNWGRTVMRVLSTHPASEERAKMVRNGGGWAATPALTDAQWLALREICD